MLNPPASNSSIPDACRPSDLDRPRNRLRQSLRWMLVALAFLGWWVSLDLLSVSRGQPSQNPLVRAQCGDTVESDCLSVLRSERARFGARRGADDQPASGGVPWAAVGTGYFAFLGIWFALVGYPERGRRRWYLPILLVMVVGVMQSVWLIRVMAFELHRWCGGCLVAHAINGAMTLLALLGMPWGAPTQNERARLAFGVARPGGQLAVAAAALAFLVGYFHVVSVALASSRETVQLLQEKYRGVVGDPTYARWRYETQQPVDLPIRPDDAISGPPDAPHTVVAFVDFQCPQCRTAHATLKRVMERHTRSVRVVYRHFPLDSACNASYPMRAHPAACQAAAAYEAARIAGGAEGAARIRQRMYDEQDSLELNPFAAWAADVGLDRTRFAAAMDSAAVTERIRADTELGKRLEIRGIPVVFMDGRRIEGWSIESTWDALLGAPATQGSAP